jgi:hypothetical protein
MGLRWEAAEEGVFPALPCFYAVFWEESRKRVFSSPLSSLPLLPSFCLSFNKGILGTCCVPGIVLGPIEKIIGKTEKE